MSKPNTTGLSGKIVLESRAERELLNRLTIKCPKCRTHVKLSRLGPYDTSINGGGTCTKTAD